ALFLERAGFAQVANLDGGVNAWAEEVDPDMPRY
ncbi:MAG TPA: sulfurtransferase, partial [Candidatus Competibacteraceae bacterium]|nr:sulfurtransferase [Candidatus Competibacteraceae bacterium]